MLLTKILTLLILSAQPQIGAVQAPVVSDVMENPSVTIRHSANLFNAEMKTDLKGMVEASFPVVVRFQLDAGTTDVLDVTSESAAVDLDEVTVFVEDYVWSDHCDD